MHRGRAVFFVLASSAVAAACGWSPSRPFDRDAPQVKAAANLLMADAGDAGGAAALLEDYLSTGKCENSNIGTPPAVRDKPNGSLDLGLALFKVGESFGKKFGEEEAAGAKPDDARASQVACALRVVEAIIAAATTPLDLKARALYLEGNLHFLAGNYEEAVTAYDAALTLAPGMNDAGDPIGRDAAWNRAIALRRIEDKDASAGDSGPESDASGDGGQGDGGQGDGGGGNGDAGGNSSPDAGSDASSPPNDSPDSGPPPPPSKSQDDRILDQLENAPTVQEEAAKRQAQRRKVPKKDDK